MMTLAEAERTFANQLKSLYDEEEAKGLVFYAIHHITGMSKSNFLINKNESISEIDQTALNGILEELKTGRPIQYILGETEFYGLTLKVNPSVLIPRPETEELVDWVVEVWSWEFGVGSGESKIRNREFEVRNILDLGTGSGCIAITLKKHLPAAKVYALDISPDALETARHNAALNSVEVEFLEVDILKGAIAKFDTKFSIIVSNPPYVSVSEKQTMHTHVLEHEPHIALFVPENDPLIFYAHIIDFAATHLLSDGLLFFEINENFGEQVCGLLDQKGFSDIVLRKDLQGKDRMIRAKF